MATLDQSYFDTLNNSAPLGYSSNTETAQSFVPSITANIHSVKVYYSRTGSPSGNLQVGIYSNSGGEPNTLLTSTEVLTASTINTSATEYTFTFGTQAELTNGTTYWIKSSASTAWDNPNNIRVYSHFPSGYASGTEALYNGSTWSNCNADENFEEYYDAPAGGGGSMLTMGA